VTDVHTNSSGTDRILIMDDEEMVRDVMCNVLKTMGFEVECCCEGSEAIGFYVLAKESGRPFSAVILDLTIPGGMGGKETIEQLIRIDPSVKAIVTSGYCDDPVMENFREHGFCAVISKPYSIKTLSGTIKEVLAGPAQ
jgi:DNA-binding NtrC family response regulator